jgi:hypothetical protein
MSALRISCSIKTINNQINKKMSVSDQQSGAGEKIRVKVRGGAVCSHEDRNVCLRVFFVLMVVVFRC